MQASQGSESSGTNNAMYHPQMQNIDHRHQNMSHYQMLNNTLDTGSQISFQPYNEHQQFFTIDSSPATAKYLVYDSPSAVSINSHWNPSPQGSQSYHSDQYHSPDTTSRSPLSGTSMVVDDGNEMRRILRELENALFDNDDGPGSIYSIHESPNASAAAAAASLNYNEDGSGFIYSIDELPNASTAAASLNYNEDGSGSIYSVDELPNAAAAADLWKYNQMLQMIPNLDLKELLLLCAEAMSYDDISSVERLLEVLERMVSVTGDPIQRLGAYMMEGLRAKLMSSGSRIYKMLKCKEPTSSELLSYMHVLYQICPYYKFAYTSANIIINEALENEPRIHIIDFQIAQGSQWMSLIQTLASRPGGPPHVRITGVDDSNSAHARGGGLDLVGQKLSEFANSRGVKFEFHAAAVSGYEVELHNLNVRNGEALAVNFPYMLHHMPDESVSTRNSRDRLLRLVKSLSPKVVALLEQESNTNTTPFYPRFRETMEYYSAMFESIDAGRGRDDKQRINAEAHCVARDIVNIIACEGEERVERHELLGKWSSRLRMAGFQQCQLSSSVENTIKDMLSKEYSPNYWMGERSGALFLGWKNRDLVTCSAWR